LAVKFGDKKCTKKAPYVRQNTEGRKTFLRYFIDNIALMYRHMCTYIYTNCLKERTIIMWREKLVEIKKSKGIKTRQIAELSGVSEKTVARILSGETDRPYMDNLHDIAKVLEISLDDLFAESRTAQLSSENLTNALDKVEQLSAELELVRAENTILKDENIVLKAKIELLEMQIKHKDEIIALHNYYNKLNN
jgi:transcriptional regulator with XRE-family HTH domain